MWILLGFPLRMGTTGKLVYSYTYIGRERGREGGT